MILIDQYIEDFRCNTQTYLTISEISLKLENKEFVLYDFEKQIRQSIYYIRTSIKRVHKDLTNDSIIESKNRKGYRLSEIVYLKRN